MEPEEVFRHYVIDRHALPVFRYASEPANPGPEPGADELAAQRACDHGRLHWPPGPLLRDRLRQAAQAAHRARRRATIFRRWLPGRVRGRSGLLCPAARAAG
ncbi:hypothetical protein [Acrocarpospora pleiomorpha]|uniref:hypothetical protein n=1 Tax=Acrocarpospora pleiomorpha TaxID=90975 RepID=UPI0012D33408|nr:hypothetical protein [Acrocarpospora pleiomorpha]